MSKMVFPKIVVSRSPSNYCACIKKKYIYIYIHSNLEKFYISNISSIDMGVSKNRFTPKWMIYNGKPYFLMDDLEVFPPIFGSTPIYPSNLHYSNHPTCQAAEHPATQPWGLAENENRNDFLGGEGSSYLQ